MNWLKNQAKNIKWGSAKFCRLHTASVHSAHIEIINGHYKFFMVKQTYPNFYLKYEASKSSSLQLPLYQPTPWPFSLSSLCLLRCVSFIHSLCLPSKKNPSLCNTFSLTFLFNFNIFPLAKKHTREIKIKRKAHKKQNKNTKVDVKEVRGEQKKKINTNEMMKLIVIVWICFAKTQQNNKVT